MAKKTKGKRQTRKANGSGTIDTLSRARKNTYEDGVSCRDWLVKLLAEHCHTEDGFDGDRFGRVLQDNGIEWEIDRTRPGWQGRYQMNGRQKLAVVAPKTGSIIVDGKKVQAPGAKRRGRKARAQAGAEP